MSRQTKLHLLVGAVAVVSCFSGAAVWSVRLPFPGWWPIATFLFVATLLESLHTRLRIAAKGSTSFIIHIASALLFGGWWAALIAAGSSLVDEWARGSTPIKLVFNTAQRALAVSLAALVYSALGGSLPPAYLEHSATLASPAVQRDLGLFFAFAIVYFVTNSAAVSGAVALSSGRAFREVWNLNTRGVLAYDLSSSLVGVLVAWIYIRSEPVGAETGSQTCPMPSLR